ncbi:hypothetical protein THAOC_18869 [Thalassiosira oceanica]|uniref:ABC transporter domain-containing protein n=1 Tax=Thalassiosira oceanica TaxID=159749 RepID=K0SR02_THAOC|nr:hypothetical protein THAOC_18869 [Thalassiosira oceanica]|eukprot:EJK60727.1 hypothetical protein THAOC_18869 [Thalassiosira oceanica]
MVFLEPPARLHTLLKEALPASFTSPDDPDEILAYIATLAKALADTQNFSSDEWVDALSPYLSNLLDDQSDVEETIAKYCGAAETALQQADDSSDEEYDYGGEEITNIRFSLAYGGKILLHQTKLRLRRGHRYALVGQNGVGKTTLMNAINNGKLEAGRPSSAPNTSTQVVTSILCTRPRSFSRSWFLLLKRAKMTAEHCYGNSNSLTK